MLVTSCPYFEFRFRTTINNYYFFVTSSFIVLKAEKLILNAVLYVKSGYKGQPYVI